MLALGDLKEYLVSCEKDVTLSIHNNTELRNKKEKSHETFPDIFKRINFSDLLNGRFEWETTTLTTLRMTSWFR